MIYPKSHSTSLRELRVGPRSLEPVVLCGIHWTPRLSPLDAAALGELNMEQMEPVDVCHKTCLKANMTCIIILFTPVISDFDAMVLTKSYDGPS